MAEARLTASLVGSKELQRGLRKLNPETNRKIVDPALIESMLLTLRIAATKKIIRGGVGGGGVVFANLPLGKV